MKLWELSSGRCLKTWTFDEAPFIVRWNPNKNISILATAIGKRVVFLNPELASSSIVAATMKLTEQTRHNGMVYRMAFFVDNTQIQVVVAESDKLSSWEQPSSTATDLGHLLHLKLPMVCY